MVMAQDVHWVPCGVETIRFVLMGCNNPYKWPKINDINGFHWVFFSPLEVEENGPHTFNDRFWAHLVGDKFPSSYPIRPAHSSRMGRIQCYEVRKKGKKLAIVQCRMCCFLLFFGGRWKQTIFWIFARNSLCFLATGNFVVFFGVCVCVKFDAKSCLKKNRSLHPLKHIHEKKGFLHSPQPRKTGTSL